jgi:diguanylate cyclase (GGDEF)-like protein
MDVTALEQEVSALRARVRELEHFRSLALIDPLTGAYNRRYCDEALAREIARCRRESGTFAILCVDLDDFKNVNDAFGHAAGDQHLQRVTALLRGCLRSQDACCRVGGDEFLLLLPGTGQDGAAQFLRRLRESADRAAGDPSVRWSVGTACWPADGETPMALFKVADDRMYDDKQRSEVRTARR